LSPNNWLYVSLLEFADLILLQFMTTVSEFNRFGEEIEELMLLRTSPLAIKMLEKESDVPQRLDDR
jgi:hypothetical protein